MAPNEAALAWSETQNGTPQARTVSTSSCRTIERQKKYPSTTGPKRKAKVTATMLASRCSG